jgi:hypothetical protein
MVRLDSKANRFVLGIEDIALASGLSDKHFNDRVVSPCGISLGLFCGVGNQATAWSRSTI